MPSLPGSPPPTALRLRPGKARLRQRTPATRTMSELLQTPPKPGLAGREAKNERARRAKGKRGPRRETAGFPPRSGFATFVCMTSFSLRQVKLRPGEQYRDELEVELSPLDFGGQRYVPVPEQVPAAFEMTRANTGTVFTLAFTA